jgi:hypothetical protein
VLLALNVYIPFIDRGRGQRERRRKKKKERKKRGEEGSRVVFPFFSY